MKSLIKVTCIAFMVTSLMAACSEETTTKREEIPNKVEASTPSKEMSEIERLEKGILLYGESAKGGYYRATVENAKYKEVDKVRYLYNPCYY